MLIEKTLYMRQTDATGSIYAPEILSLAIEVFEDSIQKEGIDLAKWLKEKKLFLPIVTSSITCTHPISLANRIQCHLSLAYLGESSFELETKLVLKESQILGATALTTYVATNGKQSVPLPQMVLDHLRKL